MKKGFTLVEIVGIVIILSIILLISFPLISNYLKESKQKAYETQLTTMLSSLKNYAVGKNNLLPREENEYVVLTLGQLKSFGIVNNNIKNPINEEFYEDSMEFVITKTEKKHNYSILEDTIDTRVTKGNSPTIELIGDITNYHDIGETYEEKGCNAFDYEGNVITDIIIDDSELDMNIEGIYKIKYEVSDNNNIKTSAYRTVIVK